MKHQRGVALITVLLVVAIVTVVSAAMVARQQLSIRASSNQLQARQAWHYALGGEALAQADKAVQGDIAGVTQSLGVAFNSTFIALLISIFLMFLVHQLQLLQERLVFDGENYANDKLIRHMKAD